MFYLVPMLIGCRLALVIRCCNQFGACDPMLQPIWHFQANCGDAEFALGGSRFKVDFGFMKQYRVDNPSITREVRRTNDQSI